MRIDQKFGLGRKLLLLFVFPDTWHKMWLNSEKVIQEFQIFKIYQLFRGLEGHKRSEFTLCGSQMFLRTYGTILNFPRNFWLARDTVIFSIFNFFQTHFNFIVYAMSIRVLPLLSAIISWHDIGLKFFYIRHALEILCVQKQSSNFEFCNVLNIEKKVFFPQPVSEGRM